MFVQRERERAFKALDKRAEKKTRLIAQGKLTPKPLWSVTGYRDAEMLAPKLAKLATKSAFLTALSRSHRACLFIDFKYTSDESMALEFAFLLGTYTGYGENNESPILTTIYGGHYVAVDEKDLDKGITLQSPSILYENLPVYEAFMLPDNLALQTLSVINAIVQQYPDIVVYGWSMHRALHMLNIFANTTNGHNPLRNLRPPLDQILDISSATESAKPILVDVAMLYGAYLTYDLVLYALDDAVRDVTTLLNFHGHNAWNDVMGIMNVFLAVMHKTTTSRLREAHAAAFKRVHEVVRNFLTSHPPNETKINFTSMVSKFAQRYSHDVTVHDTKSGPAHDLTWTTTILIDGHECGSGSGSSKTMAMEAASQKVCQVMKWSCTEV